MRGMARKLVLVALAGLLPLGLAAQAAQHPDTVRANARGQTQGRTFTRQPAGTAWRVDPTHSEVGFRVRHLLGRVRGQFTEWSGVIVTRGTDWQKGTVNIVIRSRSIDTNNDGRDADLRSPRFFATDSFPEITFESTGIVAEESKFEMSGLLTIKGHTHPVVFRGQYLGLGPDQNDKERIAFDGTAVINRHDYGITWNQVVDRGSLLGDEVELEIAVEAVRN